MKKKQQLCCASFVFPFSFIKLNLLFLEQCILARSAMHCLGGRGATSDLETSDAEIGDAETSDRGSSENKLSL